MQAILGLLVTLLVLFAVSEAKAQGCLSSPPGQPCTEADRV